MHLSFVHPDTSQKNPLRFPPARESVAPSGLWAVQHRTEGNHRMGLQTIEELEEEGRGIPALVLFPLLLLPYMALPTLSPSWIASKMRSGLTQSPAM